MRQGQLEMEDAGMLRGIYSKISKAGFLLEPLTVEEQVLLFSLAKWIEEHVKKGVINGQKRNN